MTITAIPCVPEVTTARYKAFDVVTTAHRGKCACGWRAKREHRDPERAKREAIRHGVGR